MTEWLDRLGYYFLKGFAAFIRVLPLRFAIAMGRFVGLCVSCLHSRRHVAYADLKAALGDEHTEKTRWKIIREHYKTAGQMLIEVLSFPKLTRAYFDRHVKVNHIERYHELVEKECGVVLLTGHFGNWELLQIISGLLGKPVNVLARNQRHSRLDEFLNELRESHGSVAIKRGMGVRELLRSLKRHDLIGVLGDQDAGRDQGLIVNLLGRKTTIPTGAFELSRRTASPILPCFIHRTRGLNHEIDVCDPLDCSGLQGSGEESLREKVEEYVCLLERFVRKYPSSWLWETKRWKYTWTKRILILSDGKPGHVKQSQAVAEKFRTIEKQYGRPGMEYPTETIQVEFKSKNHAKLFNGLAIFFIPFAQGRLRWLRSFVTEECAEQLIQASADFVISAGSVLVPLNLCLSKDSRAKSIVLMKPSFPFNLFAYDLAIVPMHDQGIIPKKQFRTVLSPNPIQDDQLVRDRELIKNDLRDPEKVKMALFLGGSTRDFVMDYVAVERMISALQKLSKTVGDYVVTTSRRTPHSVSEMLKNRLSDDPACQLLVIAAEDDRAHVVGGMMDAADVLMVTEDSVSMISEAVSAGKKVIIVDLETNRLPEKHGRFKAIMAEKADVTVAKPSELESVFAAVLQKPVSKIYEQEARAMQGQLQEIL